MKLKEDVTIQYGVYEIGGSIGSPKDGYDPRVGGRLVKTFDDKEEAKAYAAKRRKQLTPGEKSYYKMGYVVRPVKGN